MSLYAGSRSHLDFQLIFFQFRELFQRFGSTKTHFIERPIVYPGELPHIQIQWPSSDVDEVEVDTILKPILYAILGIEAFCPIVQHTVLQPHERCSGAEQVCIKNSRTGNLVFLIRFQGDWAGQNDSFPV